MRSTAVRVRAVSRLVALLALASPSIVAARLALAEDAAPQNPPPKDPAPPPQNPPQDPQSPPAVPAPVVPPGPPAPPVDPAAPTPPAPAAPGAPGATPPAPAPPPGPAAAPPPPRFLPEESADALAQKETQFPEDVALALAHQDAMLREHRRDEEMTRTTKRRDGNPKDPVALLLWARLRGGAEARDALQNALKARPAFPEAVQVLAELEEKEEKLDAAKAAVETLLALRGSARDWTFAGFVKERAGDYAGATEAYVKATGIDPTLAAPKINRALLLVDDDKSADGLAVLEGDPAPPEGNAYWHLALAIARRAVGQATRAKESLDAAIKAAMNDRRLLMGTAATAVRGKEPGTAQRAVDAALKAFPDDLDFLLARVIVALELQNPTEARDLLTTAAKAAPKNGRVKYLTGITELRLAHVDKAYAAFKEALATDPSNARYALGVAHSMDRKGSKDVLSAWQHVSELDPKDPEPHIDAALWLYAKGKFDDAAQHLETAVKLAPSDPEPYYLLAIIHGDRQGFMGKALDDLREYKKVGGKDEAALAWLQAMEDENSK